MTDLQMQILAYIASGLILTSFLQKKMINLRILSIIGSLLFVLYSSLRGDIPIVFINSAITLINLHWIYKHKNSYN